MDDVRTWVIFTTLLSTVVIPKVCDKIVFKDKPQPEIIFEILNDWIPPILVIFFTTFEISFLPYVFFHHPITMTLIIFAIAISPQIAGIIHGLCYGVACNLKSRQIEMGKICRFAKYGKKPDFSDGIYDISINHILYSIIANALGATCTVLLFWVAYTTPTYIFFLTNLPNSKWGDLWNILLPLFASGALIQTKTHQSKDRVKSANPSIESENRFNYFLNRPHEVLNFLHMFITYFYCSIISISMIVHACSIGPINNRANLPLPSWLLLLLVIECFAFILFSTVSDWAKGYIPENIGNLVCGPLILVVFTNAWFWGLFRDGWIIKICLLIISIGILLYSIKLKKKAEDDINKINAKFHGNIAVLLAIGATIGFVYLGLHIAI